jgi:ABC-type cobalamin/Fe3+-siderophores transport system ATPase subunit|tara:strand:+ start:616 stop:1413 length:798 start_codon:yes stop_codon:yes gene_type:complete
MTLAARNITLGYKSKYIIESTNIKINTGEITTLIGGNGSGKSTLLKALSGILMPIEGDIYLDNKPLNKWPAKQLAQNLSLLPQHPIAPENITVEQLVSHGRYPYQGLLAPVSKEDKEAIKWAIDATNLSALKNRDFNSLSGGERQRGWIALALAQKAKYLLLDEPTTYLDIGHQLEVLDLLRKLNQDIGLTLIMVLHDVNQASQYSDRLLAMKNGKIIADDKPIKVLTTELLHSLFAIESEIILRHENFKTFPYSIPIRAAKRCV